MSCSCDMPIMKSPHDLHIKLASYTLLEVFSSKMCRSIPGPNQFVPGFYPGVKQPVMKLATHAHLLLRVWVALLLLYAFKMRTEAILLLIRALKWPQKLNVMFVSYAAIGVSTETVCNRQIEVGHNACTLHIRVSHAAWYEVFEEFIFFKTAASGM